MFDVLLVLIMTSQIDYNAESVLAFVITLIGNVHRVFVSVDSACASVRFVIELIYTIKYVSIFILLS